MTRFFREPSPSGRPAPRSNRSGPCCGPPPISGLFLVVAAAEFAFWGEFNSRFDFIAVDYLVYTHEVLGNVWESYPVPLVAGGESWPVCLGIVWLTWPRGRNAERGTAPPALGTCRRDLTAIAAGLGVLAVNQGTWPTIPPERLRRAAFGKRHLLLRPCLPPQRVGLRALLSDRARRPGTGTRRSASLLTEPNSRFTETAGNRPRDHRRASAARGQRGADLGRRACRRNTWACFGNKQGSHARSSTASPSEGLLFTNLYATGTRTVRGLEALSVGTPADAGSEHRPPSRQRRPREPRRGTGRAGMVAVLDLRRLRLLRQHERLFRAPTTTRSSTAPRWTPRTCPSTTRTSGGIADEDLYSLASGQAGPGT